MKYAIFLSSLAAIIIFFPGVLAFTQTNRISQGAAIMKFNSQKSPHVNWLVIHQDEKDAIDVMRWAVKTFGGNSYLIQNKNRPHKRILKEIRGRNYFYYDPNRIFTDIGIRKTLAHCNRHVKRIKRTGYQILKSQIRQGFVRFLPLNRKTYLVALHNNDKRSSISVLDYYRKKGFFIFRNPKEQIKNFVIVTQKEDFEILMKNGINVVWQYVVNDQNNDGSLSIYCSQNKIPYINIEAVYGDKESQKKMTQIVYQKIIKKDPVQCQY